VTVQRSPLELRLQISPTARFDLIDIRQQPGCQDLLDTFPRALYCSYHTTAGYLEQSVVSRLVQTKLGIRSYMSLFQKLFPKDAGYRHDEMDLRADLSERERAVEPRNADAHLAFIGSGLRNCVSYSNRSREPVYFIDLDGLVGNRPRRRLTSIVGFTAEEVIARERVRVPVSLHPVDSVSLKDPGIGLWARLQESIARHGIEKGRVHLSLAAGEHHAGLTINEYETLLMQHDLMEVLKNPLRFMAEKGRYALTNPRAASARTLDYAKYDLVRVFNEFFEIVGMNQTRLETLLSRLIALPARRFLRMKRSVTLPISHPDQEGRGTIAEGTYQCPILVQWNKATAGERLIDVTFTRLI
jgi:thiamine phosphate synthase YjbQ (UPF0047 family)